MSKVSLKRLLVILAAALLQSSCGTSPYTYELPSDGASQAAVFDASGDIVMVKTVFHTSAGEGDLKSVKKILKNHPEFRHALFANTNVGLLSASLVAASGARTVNIRLIEYLLDNGADVNGDFFKAGNSESQLTNTPLHSAITAISLYNSEASPYNSQQMQELMEISGVKQTELSSVQERIEVIKYLISKGADVNIRTKLSGTPMEIATAHTEVMKILIEAGADTTTAENMLRKRIKSNQERIQLIKSHL